MMVEQPSNLPAQPSQQLPPVIAKAINSLPPADKKVVTEYIQSHIVQVSQTTLHVGPLPSPDMLKAYSAIVPGAADRIIKMAEDQSAHRMKLESIVIPNREKLPVRGQIFAFILGLFGISCGTYCIVNGQPVAGSVIGGSTVVSLVTVFLVGRSKQEKDLSQKRPQ